MPYIKPEDRPKFDRAIQILAQNIETPGELNYVITKLCHSAAHGTPSDVDGGSELCYSRINSVVGTLECVKQEFYRRVAVPYEDKKIEENGDV